MTVVGISSEEDMQQAPEWVASLPKFLRKIIVTTVHKGETKKVADNGEIAYFQYGYESFSFSEARNHALSLVKTDWALMLDMDERVQIFEEDVDYISSQPKEVGGLQTMLSWYNEEQGHNAVISTKILRKDVKYKYSCHEDPKPYLKENGLLVGKSPLLIRHLGYNTTEKRKNSLVRNYHLILKDLVNDPTDSKLMFDLKRTLIGMENVSH